MMMIFVTMISGFFVMDYTYAGNYYYAGVVLATAFALILFIKKCEHWDKKNKMKEDYKAKMEWMFGLGVEQSEEEYQFVLGMLKRFNDKVDQEVTFF